MNDECALIEEGTQQNLSRDDIDKLVSAGLAYRCPDCGDDIYHIGIDEATGDVYPWSRIDKELA